MVLDNLRSNTPTARRAWGSRATNLLLCLFLTSDFAMEAGETFGRLQARVGQTETLHTGTLNREGGQSHRDPDEIEFESELDKREKARQKREQRRKAQADSEARAKKEQLRNQQDLIALFASAVQSGNVVVTSADREPARCTLNPETSSKRLSPPSGVRCQEWTVDGVTSLHAVHAGHEGSLETHSDLLMPSQRRRPVALHSQSLRSVREPESGLMLRRRQRSEDLATSPQQSECLIDGRLEAKHRDQRPNTAAATATRRIGLSDRIRVQKQSAFSTFSRKWMGNGRCVNPSVLS